LIVGILFALVTSLLIGFIVILVFYIKSKENVKEAAWPTPTILPQSSSMRITHSGIGAQDVVTGDCFSTAASGVLQTKVVYSDGKGESK
jgi:hypothetical protein